MPKPPLKLREKLVALLEARMAETTTDSVTLAKLTGVTKRCIDKWRSGETFSIDGIEDALVKMGAKVNVVVLLPGKGNLPYDHASSEDKSEGVST